MILDYSTARPTIAELRALGVTAVGRYLGWDSVPGYNSIGKNLLKPEAQTLMAGGIHVFLSFEYAANAAANGTAQGLKDGVLGSEQILGLGFEDAADPMSVYYAVDWDVPDYAPKLAGTPANAKAKLGPIADYFEAIHSTKPNHLVCAYGGFYAISRLFDAGLISKGWQTIAWSGGQWDPRAIIRQELSQVLGADVDILSAVNPDFGQWPRPAVPTPPPPASGPYRHVATGEQSWNQIAASRGANAANLLKLSVGEWVRVAADEKTILGLKLPDGMPWYSVNP